MQFGYVVTNSIFHNSTVGIFEIIFLKEKKKSHEDSTSGGLNLFSVSLTFGNSIGAVGGITEGISAMKFGKEFKTHLEDTIPEWRDKFLCYKPLKKLLKQNLPSITTAITDIPINLPLHLLQQPSSPQLLQAWFVRILNEELEKFNDFYVDKEEEFVIRFQGVVDENDMVLQLRLMRDTLVALTTFKELKERIECLKEKSSQGEVYTSDCEFSEEMMDIRKDLVTIHGEMVLLKNYSSLNFAGLVKILKKYDKRTGGLLRLPFTQLVLRQPFFTTEPLTRLVHECEENLELLFPLQAEVIQSTPPPENQSRPPVDSATNALPEASSTLGDETVYIYRSTLAAMRAIKGLQKASSTSNPFSFSSLFSNQDGDGTGAVTAENSAANSPATLQNEESVGKEETDSVPPNLSQKNDDIGLRWIVVKFEHHIRNPIPSILTIVNCKKTFRS
ncbi:SPX domain-containing protein 4 [Glycine soja]